MLDRYRLVLMTLILGASACGGDPSAPVDLEPDPDPDPIAEARAATYTRINQLRATEGKSAYVIWTAGEACADGQAEDAAASNEPHGRFGECSETGQNVCIGYSSLAGIAETCMQQMWDEGPGDFATHGHYLNLSSTTFKKVAVGLYITPSDDVWAVLNFSSQ